MRPRKDVLTVLQAAQYLGIHPMTLYKFARKKQVPALKLGGQWRFHRVALSEWLKSSTTTNRRIAPIR